MSFASITDSNSYRTSTLAALATLLTGTIITTACGSGWNAETDTTASSATNLPQDEPPPVGDGGGTSDSSTTPTEHAIPHMRIVWVQDTGDGTDFNSSRPQQILMGIDSEDDRGERPILESVSNYVKPLITPRGDRVIFSNRQEKSVYVVDWNGNGLRRVADGFALDVWQDPDTGTEWVYSGTDEARTQAISYHTIRRHRIDYPANAELIWDTNPVSEDNFQLSLNGRSASGVFPWPHVGLADLTTGQWVKLGEGCWTALAPGGTDLAWYFDGSHRNLTIVDITDDARWRIPINNAPGVEGFEVYHPRWSNHPRFLTMTGPYTVGDGSNKIRGGGGGVEVYLGRFTADYQTIEHWIRVTNNTNADFYPDAWINLSAVKPTERIVVASMDTVTTNPPDAFRRVVVEVEVRHTARLPTPMSIAPYREGLLALEYKVLRVIQGSYKEETIVAAHWIIDEATVLSGAERPANQRYELTLERYDDHTELEGRRLIIDVDDLTLPIYYDINSRP